MAALDHAGHLLMLCLPLNFVDSVCVCFDFFGIHGVKSTEFACGLSLSAGRLYVSFAHGCVFAGALPGSFGLSLSAMVWSVILSVLLGISVAATVVTSDSHQVLRFDISEHLNLTPL